MQGWKLGGNPHSVNSSNLESNPEPHGQGPGITAGHPESGSAEPTPLGRGARAKHRRGEEGAPPGNQSRTCTSSFNALLTSDLYSYLQTVKPALGATLQAWPQLPELCHSPPALGGKKPSNQPMQRPLGCVTPEHMLGSQDPAYIQPALNSHYRPDWGPSSAPPWVRPQGKPCAPSPSTTLHGGTPCSAPDKVRPVSSPKTQQERWPNKCTNSPWQTQGSCCSTLH